jgi:hypothetical protein
MTIYLLFLLGVISYVTFDWARWKTPGAAWSEYWPTHAGANVANAIMAMMAFLAWRGKVLGSLLELVGFNTDSPLLTVEVGPLIAPVAGFVLSTITMFVSRKVWPAKGD